MADGAKITEGFGPSIDTREVSYNGETRHQQVVRIHDQRTLTERMFAKAKAPGYQLRVDYVDPLHLYIAEAPAGVAVGTAEWRGMRMPLTEGAVQEATDFAWASRTTAAWVNA